MRGFTTDEAASVLTGPYLTSQEIEVGYSRVNEAIDAADTALATPNRQGC